MLLAKSKTNFGLNQYPVQHQVRSSGTKLARVNPDREVVARANPKFARANSNREMVARAYPCPLERLHPESGSLELTSSSLERTLQNFTPSIQRVVHSSERFRKPNLDFCNSLSSSLLLHLFHNNLL
eukprot:TRINITY_DN809_c0_g1_i9.p1 TRINITY_DN809_c0_g1~~TRINITY_DN809_c0_g1_i9.p1  ORF type:complete len:127 (+),score=10.26 TRINITY_DN809_c0_g1_i9:354-734(+)